MVKTSAIVGAILGDIAGSRIEFSRPRDFDYKTAPLFTATCRFTDDTVMTLATKYAMNRRVRFEEAYRKFGRAYQDRGYGGMFREWLMDEHKGAYNSFGNGSAMRVSYIGQHLDSLDSVLRWAKKSAECTHNHPEGIKGALATAGAVWLAKQGNSKEDIKTAITNNFGYNLEVTLDEIRPTYTFDETCQGSLPLALRCFYESTDYVSCIRNVFSINCDVDTIACIAGGIAAAYYKTTGLDNEKILREYLDDNLFNLLNRG